MHLLNDSRPFWAAWFLLISLIVWLVWPWKIYWILNKLDFGSCAETLYTVHIIWWVYLQTETRTKRICTCSYPLLQFLKLLLIYPSFILSLFLKKYLPNMPWWSYNSFLRKRLQCSPVKSMSFWNNTPICVKPSQRYK